MKLKFSLLCIALATVAASATAGEFRSVPPPVSITPSPGHIGPYLTLQGGALWLQDASLGPVDVEFDVGFSAIGTFGYAFGNGFALELESGYAQSDVDQVKFGRLSGDFEAEYKQIPIMANAVYLAELTDRFGLYVGAGAGTIWSEFDSDDFEGEDSWNFAFQAKAGASFKITEAASFNVGYRLLYGVDAFSIEGAEDDSISHVVEAGFTIRF